MCIEWVQTNVLSPAVVAISSGAECVRAKAEECVLWLDKSITDLTHTVFRSNKVAVVAEAILRSLPFFAMRLFCSTPLFWTGLGTIIVYKAITTPEGKAVTMPAVENGLGFAGLILGTRQILQGIGSNTLATSIMGIGNIVASLFLLLKTDFIKNVGEALPSQPGESNPQQKVDGEEKSKEPSASELESTAQAERQGSAPAQLPQDQ